MNIEEEMRSTQTHQVDDIEDAKANSIFEETAVGYKEYREGLHVELSRKDWLIFEEIELEMVYAGYFFGQYPCGWLVGRFPAQRVLGASCFVWGIMVLILTQCQTFSSALAVRFIMGIFEAAVTPGLTLMTGFWYTRAEIPLRSCIWYSALGWAGIIGSYMSFGIAKLPADFSPARWELLFYILGGVTCLWAAVIFFVLPDSPSSAFFLTKYERIIAVKRVAANETGIKNKAYDVKQGLLAFRDPKAILLFISIFAAAIPNGVVNSFSTVIIEDMGFSTTKTTELKSVGDAIVIVSLVIGGTITLNVPNSRLLTSTAANILCTVAAACLAYLPREEKWSRLVCFWLVNAQSVGFAVSLVTISSNMAGYTHRAMANALVFTAYCWGNFAGPFVVKPSQAPEYKGASVGLLVGYAIKLACHISLFGYMFIINRRRDRLYGPADKARSNEAGMQDQTEFENKDFRYVL
ncbi:Major facilitator superfamily domain general substrate transporter [Penicillium angulare]|uniref:Major facilitator superfamily domain general substrate transporter n=1 Tax=Penicillium angulare TaxID=116970 RepID=UPI00253FC7FD|nr:Major facilitator superfamily domain general substrate transporter [Penicillium angulare]KAJ5291631.1 Major facilitator superfamily domain general substrate transporter [Penicillium angulare]